MAAPPLAPALFDFLRALAASNDRARFKANKARYRAEGRDPMLEFIRTFTSPDATLDEEARHDPRTHPSRRDAAQGY